MNTPSAKFRAVAVYVGLSILVHLLLLMSLGRFGTYSFAAPVNLFQAVMVDLAEPPADDAPVIDSEQQETGQSDDGADDDTGDRALGRVQAEDAVAPSALPEKGPDEPKVMASAVIAHEKAEPIVRASDPAPAPSPPPVAQRRMASAMLLPPPLRTAGEFLTSKSEKLSYLISLLGVPVGSVELEAKNENGEVRIALRTKTNSALSAMYPVDNLMETRHIGGNFIITKIKQHEGSFISDIGFTLFLRDKRVFWMDRTRNRVSNETVPTSDVLDTLSSFYYLRNRPLRIGTTELLHIYDGDVYAPVPVEIVGQEEVRLRNFKKVDCLMVRHVKQNDGIFRRSGDMTIWLTNDANKVPVKVVTTSPLGNVTVELVDAVTTP